MSVTKDMVVATAKLVRLDLTAGMTPEQAEQSLEEVTARMNAVVEYLDIVQEVNTEGIEPLYFPARFTSAPRPDVAMSVQTPDSLLANAPERSGNFYAVPPIL